LSLPILTFFFQAEDGIRDGHVTGVQTCALPISEVAQGFRPRIPTTAGTGREGRPRPRSARCPHPRSMRSCPAERQSAQLDLAAEIGRASCRERGGGGGGAGARTKRQE